LRVPAAVAWTNICCLQSPAAIERQSSARIFVPEAAQLQLALSVEEAATAACP
jgi:hypothetical protein